MTSKQTLSGDEIVGMGLDDWRSMHLALQARFLTGNFATGLKLVEAIGAAAEEMNHHPDVDLRYPHVNVLLTSHDAGGKTERDVKLAGQISAAAAELGVKAADPRLISRIEFGLDTPDSAEIRPFWAAVLGMTEDAEHDEIRDDAGDFPTIWFQESGKGSESAQRWHPDVRVPPEEAQPRIDAALAVGGVLVSDDRAPRFTVLADPQGNQVCVCTHVGRSD